MKLNAAQEEAVKFREGPCMVLAGPGSGKTTVIAARAVSLAKEGGVKEEEILVVTFTKAAAEEMRARYLRFAGKESTAIAFGTFHAVFFAILREEYRLGPEAVLREGEKARLMEEAVLATDRGVGTDREFIKTLLSAVSAVKNFGKAPETFRDEIRQVDFPKVYRAYEALLKKRGALDFDDMLTMTKELFRKKPETLEHWQKRFRYIMIDEFQDANPVQVDVIRLLALPENNLFVVGDDDQSIYGFRGAYPEAMLGFPKRYPGAKRILLGTNYRSAETIVRKSLRLIGQNEERFQKKLKAVKPGGEVTVRAFPTEAVEYAEVSGKIAEHIAKGTSPDAIAVLFRTNGGMSGILQEFMERKIPFISRDRVPNLFAHFAVKPLFAVLNFLGGNHTRLNFFQFMNCPYRSFRREDFREPEVDLKALAKEYEGSEERHFMAGRVRTFGRQLEFMKGLKLPYAMIHYFRHYLEYDRHLEELAARRGMEAKDLLAVLDEVQASAKPFSNVEDWYRHVAKYSRELQEASEKERKSAKGKVTVSTLHAAKGLEYREVWILDVNERVIPHERSRTDSEIEEERRLFYVGMTRAAETLMLCYAKNRFGRESEPSRFLGEI